MSATLVKGQRVAIAASAIALVDGLPAGAAIAVQLVGTFTATVTFEATLDGTNWQAIGLFPVATPTGTPATTATAVGMWQTGPLVAYAAVRARVSAFTSSPSGFMAIRAVGA